ncbi:4-hydroxy-3-methylbut-2-enyl diphosphate reductase [Thomasclavelia cocleata]|uniref:4-hydroxy-3-methylbut-2-enyl diphosphate reductase n=1 Tax=Thomasclavelia cocleata TaxID=69824 RepID=UPI00242C16C7|nr:4-hydroxy-3-methylbut-2-enyl diphosphate reductase [Thomasclavelia cocleata]
MKVYQVVPRGYCKGVIQAIEIAKKQAYQDDTYILGMIVHNQYIVDALENLGIKTIDKKGASREELLDLVDQGTVIITAHGASEQVINKARKKNLNVIDATCPDVIKTHDLIKRYLDKKIEILYIGKSGHPESEGALSIDSKHIHLIETKKDIDNLNPNLVYVITNQTTMSLYDVYDLCEYAKTVLKNITIAKETCQATTIRQEAIAKINDDVDVVFIVGDPHSNNTQKLASISSNKANKTTYMIESVDDITLEMLKDKKVAAVSSGASTPTYLTNQVINYLKQFNYHDTSTYIKPNIDLNKIL